MITRTVITITHTRGDTLDIKVNFEPSVTAKGPCSPAHALGAEFLEFISKRNEVKSASASSGGQTFAATAKKEGA